MTKLTRSVVVLLVSVGGAVALTVACTSFSSGDAPPPADAGSTADVDASADASPMPEAAVPTEPIWAHKVMCPSAGGAPPTFCNEPLICCHPNAPNGGECLPVNSCAEAMFACDDFADCDGGSCCADRDTTTILSTFCTKTAVCEANVSTLCHPVAENALCGGSLRCAAGGGFAPKELGRCQ